MRCIRYYCIDIQHIVCISYNIFQISGARIKANAFYDGKIRFFGAMKVLHRHTMLVIRDKYIEFYIGADKIDRRIYTGAHENLFSECIGYSPKTLYFYSRNGFRSAHPAGGIKGNAVQIGNSSRCCKLFSPKGEDCPALYTTGPFGPGRSRNME